jgi:U3 small nucleolar RNA-associated protein 5
VYCLTASDGLLYAAGCSLNVWDLASKKIVQNFTGHATAISQILPTVTAAVNGLPGKSSKLCLTIADQDRFVNIWSGEPNASETTALTLEANPRMIANMNGRVLAVTEEGMVAVWRQPFQAVTKKQKKSRTKRFELLLKIEEDQSPSTILPIAAAKFIQPEQIVVVYGSLVKPKIEIIHLEEQTAAVSDNTIVLKRQANNNIFIDNDQQRARQQLKASQKLYNENGAVIAAQNNFIPTRMALEIEEEQVLANGEASAGNDLTLQEKLDALTVSDEQAAGKNTTGGVNNSGKPQSSKKSNGAPRADSIQQMLVQALHSEDHQLLDECLEMGDLRLIFNTVHRLPTAFVVPFLKQVVRRFQSRPGRGIKLAKWIKAVLLIHMAYLMTVPGLTNELGPLYQTIDMRLAAFKKLLRLQGRLDVLDQHIRLRQEAAQQQQQLNDESALEAPMVVYDENEASWSEEEDDMEIEEGLAEDAAVVENDSEGWSSSDDDQYGDELDGEDDDDDEDEDPEEDD